MSCVVFIAISTVHLRDTKGTVPRETLAPCAPVTLHTQHAELHGAQGVRTRSSMRACWVGSQQWPDTWSGGPGRAHRPRSRRPGPRSPPQTCPPCARPPPLQTVGAGRDARHTAAQHRPGPARRHAQTAARSGRRSTFSAMLQHCATAPRSLVTQRICRRPRTETSIGGVRTRFMGGPWRARAAGVLPVPAT